MYGQETPGPPKSAQSFFALFFATLRLSAQHGSPDHNNRTAKRSNEMNAQNYDTYGDVMTVTEVGILLGASRQQVYRFVREGRLQGIRIGRGYKIPKSAVIALLEGRELDDDD
jgi:excisionase family DNA binding protein